MKKSWCSKCKTFKEYSAFAKGRTIRGIQSNYRVCRSKHYYYPRSEILKQNERERRERMKAENPERYRLTIRVRALKRNYGMTEEDYEKMFKKQKGLCAICQTDKKSKFGYLVIDHNHKSEKIRGLLCFKCNMILGFLEDKKILRTALKYLKKYDQNY